MRIKIAPIVRFPLFFFAFVVLGLTIGYLTFKVLSYSRSVEVPSLINLTLLEANEELSRLGLYLDIEDEDYDSTIKAGRILRQNIPPRNIVKEKRSIKVILSKGPRVYFIPYIVNQTLSDAEGMLSAKGLKIGKLIYVHSDAIPKGKVIAQKPEPDERASDLITALVSLGPHEVDYYCPDFINKDISFVKEITKNMGLEIHVRGEGNIVQNQNPMPGVLIKTGSKIIIDARKDRLLDMYQNDVYEDAYP